MKIQRNINATFKGPCEWFTGDVYVDPVSIDGSGINAALVHFTPGARTAWHTHELGQTIHVTEGIGRVQCEGKPIEIVHPGDTVYFEPGERHWHGAAPDRFMVHLALQRLPESGQTAEWGEKVTDSQYETLADDSAEGYP